MRAAFLSLLLLLSACTGGDGMSSEVSDSSATVTQEGDPNAGLDEIIVANAPPPPDRAEKLRYQTSDVALAAALPVEPVANRMVIRNANLRLAVAEPESAAVTITKLIETRGGYLANSRQWREGDALRAHLMLRVPAERLSETLTAVRDVAVRVDEESVSGQDVTAEYTDLAARLRNLELAETELRELLSTTRERSQRASDILDVYNQLSHIRGEVERTKGRIQYLSQMTAYSTVQVELYQDEIAGPLVASGWRPILAVREAGAQLVRTLQDVVEFGIWLAIYILPLLAIIGLPLYGLYRLLRSWRPRHVVSSEMDG